MKVYLKNMVCQGTRKFVMMEIKKLGFTVLSFESGEIEFNRELTPSETSQLGFNLSKYGLEMTTENDNLTNVSFSLNGPELKIPQEEFLTEENEFEPAELSSAN